MPQGPITRGVQQGVLRHLEQPSVTVRIPATRSNPAFEFGRKFREQKEYGKIFIESFAAELPLSTRISSARLSVQYFKDSIRQIWKEKEKMSEHEFYYHALLKGFIFHGRLTDTQLRDVRTFYEKAVSHPEVFTSDIAFADALSGCLGISFVGDAYLAEKILSLAKQAPEGKRFLTDFTVVRSLLNLERYDLVQELMDFRQAQEGWFIDGQLITEGETARVYEEVKLYQQTIKDIPVTFPEELPARRKFTFSQADDRIEELMENRTRAMLFQRHYGKKIIPETSAEGLNWFLQYKHRDFTKKPQ